MLTDEQQSIMNRLVSFVLSKTPGYITVGGYAGTGKTYLITQVRKELKKILNLSVAFLTFTGKSSSVLKAKLEEEDQVYSMDRISTIHSLIYHPIVSFDFELNRPVISGWKKVDDISYDLIIIDEASMVSKDIWEDLLSYDIPIIAVGDHGQLPPVGDEFSLMKQPSEMLHTIHRQAQQSPIIRLSMFVRDRGYIPHGVFSKEVFKLSWNFGICQDIWKNKLVFDQSLIVLCGFNKTRVKLNNMIRERKRFIKEVPYPTERIICLKNNHTTKISNGQIGTIVWILPQGKNFYRITIQLDNMKHLYENLVYNDCFGKESYAEVYHHAKKSYKYKGLDTDYFDFGYAISVHKSQGSEWDKVVLFEQRTKYWDDDIYRRWLYTAVTRAKKKLFIISDFY